MTPVGSLATGYRTIYLSDNIWNNPMTHLPSLFVYISVSVQHMMSFAHTYYRMYTWHHQMTSISAQFEDNEPVVSQTVVNSASALKVKVAVSEVEPHVTQLTDFKVGCMV